MVKPPLAYRRLVVKRKDVVDVALDDGRLARANVADDEHLVQVLLHLSVLRHLPGKDVSKTSRKEAREEWQK